MSSDTDVNIPKYEKREYKVNANKCVIDFNT